MANKTSRGLESAAFKLDFAMRRAIVGARTATVMRKPTPPGMLPVDLGIAYYDLLEAKKAIEEATVLIDEAMATFQKLDKD